MDAKKALDYLLLNPSDRIDYRVKNHLSIKNWYENFKPDVLKEEEISSTQFFEFFNEVKIPSINKQNFILKKLQQRFNGITFGKTTDSNRIYNSLYELSYNGQLTPNTLYFIGKRLEEGLNNSDGVYKTKYLRELETLDKRLYSRRENPRVRILAEGDRLSALCFIEEEWIITNSLSDKIKKENLPETDPDRTHELVSMVEVERE